MSNRDADEVADEVADAIAGALEVESRKLCKESPDGVQGKFDSYYSSSTSGNPRPPIPI